MTLLPIVDGDHHDNDTRSRPITLDKKRGAPGNPGMLGVAETVVENAPRPAEFTALTRNAYITPFVRPVTVADGDADVPSANVVHVDELLVEYSTT